MGQSVISAESAQVCETLKILIICVPSAVGVVRSDVVINYDLNESRAPLDLPRLTPTACRCLLTWIRPEATYLAGVAASFRAHLSAAAGRSSRTAAICCSGRVLMVLT